MHSTERFDSISIEHQEQPFHFCICVACIFPFPLLLSLLVLSSQCLYIATRTPRTLIFHALYTIEFPVKTNYNLECLSCHLPLFPLVSWVNTVSIIVHQFIAPVTPLRSLHPTLPSRPLYSENNQLLAVGFSSRLISFALSSLVAQIFASSMPW